MAVPVSLPKPFVNFLHNNSYFLLSQLYIHLSHTHAVWQIWMNKNKTSLNLNYVTVSVKDVRKHQLCKFPPRTTAVKQRWPIWTLEHSLEIFQSCFSWTWLQKLLPSFRKQLSKKGREKEENGTIWEILHRCLPGGQAATKKRHETTRVFFLCS